MNAINVLWANVERAGRAMLTASGRYAWGADDDAMRDAPADDLFSWADDCADRLGADEGGFRAALLAFVAYRDDGAGLDSFDYAAALQEAADIVDGDAGAMAELRARVVSRCRAKHAIYGANPAWRDALAAWRDALARVGGGA